MDSRDTYTHLCTYRQLACTDLPRARTEEIPSCVVDLRVQNNFLMSSGSKGAKQSLSGHYFLKVSGLQLSLRIRGREHVFGYLYINSHNSDPLWIKWLKKLFWTPPPGNHETSIKIKEKLRKINENQRKIIKNH